MPSLEDANSIQVGLAEVMRQLGAQTIDHKTAALFLYALQIASANVKFTNFEPEQKTQVVIDRECVSKRPLGASAWSMVEGKDYDDPEEINGASGVPARPPHSRVQRDEAPCRPIKGGSDESSGQPFSS